MKIQKKDLTPGVDVFKHMFMKLFEKDWTRSDAIDNDITELFWFGIFEKVKAKELIRTTIRGEVRTGKSTVGLAIKAKLNQAIRKLGLNKNITDEFKTILGDQLELIRFFRNPLDKQICVQVDEYSASAEGGANATTEQQMLQSYSDMNAGEYLHVINCNPTRLTDSNSFLELEVVGKNKKNWTTRVLIKYRDIINNDELYLGFADISVKELIYNWETNVRHVFEKNNHTKEELKFIEEQAEKDYYVRYIKRKYKRMNFLRSGLRDIRDLEYSETVLKVFQKLSQTAKVGFVTSELLIPVTQDIVKKQGLIFSFYTETVVLTRIKGLLYLLTTIEEQRNAIAQGTYKRKKLRGELMDTMRATLKQTKQLLSERLQNEAEMARDYELYLEIE